MLSKSIVSKVSDLLSLLSMAAVVETKHVRLNGPSEMHITT